MVLFQGSVKNEDGEDIKVYKTKLDINVINYSKIIRIHI